MNQVRDGGWTETAFGSATAQVKKSRGDHTVMITVQSIPWKAAFDVDDESKQQEAGEYSRLRVMLPYDSEWNHRRHWSSALQFNSRDYTAYVHLS